MKRFNIYLSETQRERLNNKASALGIPFSELVRRVLDAWLESEDKKEQSNDRPRT